MDILQSLYSEEGDGPVQSKRFTHTSIEPPKDTPTIKSLVVNLTPEVPYAPINEFTVDPTSKEMLYNPTFEALWAPIQSVTRPFEKASIQSGIKNHLTGFVQEHNMNDYTFKDQFYTAYHKSDEQEEKKPKPEKRKRKPQGDPAEVDTYLGPWAPFEEDEDVEVGLSDEQRKMLEQAMEGRKRHKAPKGEEKDKKEGEEEKKDNENSSIFHGKELRDYLGRSYVDPPTDLKQTPHDTYPMSASLPPHRHTKAVSAARLFPKYGHLVLSAGMDNLVKIWDVYNNQKCLRTFMGHQRAVRDVCWSNDGRRFLSYDKYVKLWDSETGACLGSYSHGKIPYCVKFHPDHQNLFVTGCSDKRIIQWDANSKRIVQEYDQHLGAVNTITFIDNNRRFVSSSDDKSLRVWEWGIPVVIKYISEPHMHSMPAVTVHPNGNWFACQSLDNQILIYSTRDRFKLHKKKRFQGHTVAGYACQMSFSPDGRYLVSGDGSGRAWFWDWKTTKLLKTLRCHDQVTIGCEWHPIEPSKVVTCSWDGTIKYWD